MSPPEPMNLFQPLNMSSPSSSMPLPVLPNGFLNTLKIPKLQERAPMTWRAAPHAFAYMLPLLYMAYLVRRPNTYTMRLLLLPLTVLLAVHGTSSYMFTRPEHSVYNWLIALVGLSSIAKALDYTFAREGRYKIGEQRPGDEKVAAIALADAHGDITNGSALPSEKPSPSPAHFPFSILPRWFIDAIEILCTMRGYGWDFGVGVHVPPEKRPIERSAFLRSTSRSFLINFLILDLLESTLKLIPGVGSPFGSSIFISHLPTFQKYIMSTFINFCTGTSFFVGFYMVYDLLTLIAVVGLGHSPSSWPPVMDNPWISTSLHEFWAKRWHQILRQTFLDLGGYPGRWLFSWFGLGSVGMVVGTFAASAIFHEGTIYLMGRGWDNRVLLFFVLQAFNLFAERMFRVITGRRVGGVWGTVWVYVNLIFFAQPCVDAWHSRGLAGGLVIPPVFSPTRNLIFRFVSHLTKDYVAWGSIRDYLTAPLN